MRSGWGWVVLAVALLGAPAAQACLPDKGWPDEVQVNEGEAAALLVQSASFVDLAEVETMTPDPAQKARVGPLLEGGAVTIHLRVLQRLKGNPVTPVRDLSGIDMSGDFPDQPTLAKPFGALTFSIARRELSQVAISGCLWLEAIGAAPGAKFLVFRDAEGGLLNLRIPVRFQGRYLGVWGPSFTPVTGLDDAWVRLVDKEITDHGSRFVDPSERPRGPPPPPPGW